MNSQDDNQLGVLERQRRLEEKFKTATSWEDRYKMIIAMGKALGDFPEELRTEDAKVKGCQSQVWLHARCTPEGLVEFMGDSDALLVRGLVAVLLYVYSLQKPEDILHNPPHFLKAMGFEENLSPSRSNGLNAMIKQIKTFAMAFWMLDQQKKGAPKL